MRSALLKAVFATVFALSAYAQTITTTNALGLTVVELITLNPLGLATTETLSTLTGATTRTTTTPLTTTTPTATTTAATQNGGAVEDSPTGGAATQTVYQYSTTDAAGNTVVQQATFIPTFAPTTTRTPTASGTVLQYSEWATSAATAVSSAAPLRDMSWLFGGLGSFVAILGGGMLLVA